MARKIIDIGAVGNDGTGDSIRDSFRKVNDNFRELYSSLGLGEKLTFIGLDDTPSSYAGQNNTTTGATPVLTVNDTESGVAFKQLTGGIGINIDFSTEPGQIIFNTEFANIVDDASPQLGGNLSAVSGGDQWRIKDLAIPVTSDEAVNKAYADTKLSRAGVNAIDPATGFQDSRFGRMSGPLVLSRSPEPEDDELYGGLIAATKQYVDNAAFGSIANLYVATSGVDERPGVSKTLQGRALAYAYRTIEAACKRAEELVLESRFEIGPYKKVLTYGDGAGVCTLTDISTSPSSGTGFIGTVRMSLATATLVGVGANYFPGDILTISGGTVASGGGAATIEVLTTTTTPGAIASFRIVSTGVYSTSLPLVSSCGVVITNSAAPVEIGAIGLGATFDLTFKVNSVAITNPGTGYSLVSVRITGGGGAGAFGTGVVTSGGVSSITITDQGSGFISIPTLSVDLPRFSIFTNNQRTDFTGDVLTDTPEAYRGRDIREGLYLRGESSGALAQILSHSGELDSLGNELFDVDIKYGAFEFGEAIAYGDVTKNVQVTILVESGIYEENLPIKVPQNCSIVGDEFRRCIIRPRVGTSSSPWAFQKFRRDITIDGLSTATSLYGYHYLQDSSQPVYPKINNKGAYTAAASLLELNKVFIQEEIIAWMNDNITNNTPPFTSTFEYNERLCKRDVGMIVDALVFDIKWGSYNRTISAGLKYYQSASARIAITTQLSQYLAVMDRINVLIQSIITNTLITNPSQDLFIQIVDFAYSAEVGSSTVITALIAALKDVMDGSGSVNYPKDSDAMDMFLANDAVRWQGISGQGHGGFMLVLDPEGQILAKSPYAQECASFSKSQDRQVFAGGMFVDGFAGNLQFTMDTIVTPTRIQVSGLDRFPQLPCSFIVADSVYRVNYIRDFVYDPNGSSGTLILDETTPWPFDIFTYNEAACFRDTGYIIDGLGYDIVFGTNYNTRLSGLTYRLSNAAVVIEDQRIITVEAIGLAHDLASAAVVGTVAAENIVELSKATIVDIIERGTSAAPTLTYTVPPGASTNLVNAFNLLLANRNYIVAEVQGWIQAQIAGPTAPWQSGDTYNIGKSQRDTQLVIESVIYDLLYGGNSATRVAALKYYNNLTGASLLASGQPAKCASAITYASYLAQRVIQNLAPAVTYSTLTRVTGSAASATEATTINTLMTAVASAISVNNFASAEAAITLVLPNVGSYSYTPSLVTARSNIVADKTDIQTTVVEYVNLEGNRYELLMPGNRSMLSNDFTQINDLGYGIVTTNGGLVEAVSMFTYYCHISYYSLNGGQIRSVGGSSAHGNYALVAEGADPLEVPTPTAIYEELSQRAKCYFPSPSYANTLSGLFIYVYAYEYTPLGSAELEIDHGGVIYRYPVNTVTTTDLPAGVARLNLGGSEGAAADGLFAQVPNDTVLTIRTNGQILLTGDLAEVAVRPSTGLKLRETDQNVYRVLQFTEYPDSNAPYQVSVTQSDPAIFKILVTITDIATNLCTTSTNHKLRVGDKFIPSITSNGLVANNTYYVIGIPEYNQFYLSLSPGGISPTLTDGSSLFIQGAKTHKLSENYTLILTAPTLGNVVITGTSGQFSCDPTTLVSGQQVTVSGINSGTGSIAGYASPTTYYIIATNGTTTFTLSTTPSGSAVTTTTGTPIGLAFNGTFPSPLTANDQIYFVRSQDLTDTEFTISTQRNGTAVAVVGAGTGTFGYTLFGLTRTVLRENYNYNDLTLFQPGEFTSDYPSGRVCTVSIATPAVITLNSHGFAAGDVVKFETTGSLPTGVTTNNNFHVLSTGLGLNSFQISLIPGGDPVDSTGSQIGTHTVGKIYGGVGDTQFAVVAVATQDIARVAGSKFMFLGEEYVVSEYQPESVTNTSFARVILNRPLVNSIVAYQNAYTVKSAVAIRTSGSLGSLTIRISLTRVTSHDLLEIGTGSYADTNYPSEIYGPPVNPINDSNETEERDVGRCFYVTTDQFGNFSVGPYFRVDQGTGTVTFAAAIALSNLDGIGFKRGVPVSEFSTDSGFTDNATDTVPTENAARIYIERRLGLTHDGAIVTPAQLIPTVTGGYMSLDGQLGMKGTMNLNNHKIINLTNATDAQDAVNLRSLTFDNFQDTTITDPTSADILTFTGVGNFAQNSKVVGDVTFSIDSTANTVDVQINPDTIIDADVKSDAAIVQSKLNMNAATTRANATGIVQADRGLSSFDNSQFTVTNGWVSLKTNGTPITRLEQIASQKILGNSSLGTADVQQVDFTTVVADGNAVKKLQYGQYGASTGFLRRITTGDLDTAFTTVEAATGTAISPEASKIIIRDSNGDFGARIADLSQVKLDAKVSIDTATTASGGYIRYYGWDTAGGILISNGSLAADKKTAYWNNSHDFKTQDGLSAAPIIASSIQVTTLTTGGNQTPGKITGRWELTGTSPDESRLQSTYSADLAENYEGDKEYEVGTVLVFGGDKEVTVTNVQGDARVAGVVSNTAAFAMFEGCPGLKNLVALQGRVPCKVVGKINKGDMLVTSKISGVAVFAGDNPKVGTIVGKALESYDSDHIGTIEIAVGRT